MIESTSLKKPLGRVKLPLGWKEGAAKLPHPNPDIPETAEPITRRAGAEQRSCKRASISFGLSLALVYSSAHEQADVYHSPCGDDGLVNSGTR